MLHKSAHLEKFIALVLRHKPERLNLRLDKAGWVDFADLRKALADEQDVDETIAGQAIEHMVENSDKKRFEFSADSMKIRACQGHSVDVDLELKSIRPPIVLYHGTSVSNVDSILKHGINAGSRHAVHLSGDKVTAMNVGSRRGKAVVLVILASKMHFDGHLFYKSNNGVWLTDFIPPEYIDVK